MPNWRRALLPVALVLALTPSMLAVHASDYTIQPGDTLWRIAQWNHTSVGALQDLNELSSDQLVTGQRLIIPDDTVVAPATTRSAVNLRASPSTSSTIRSVVPANTSVQVQARSNSWCRVTTPSGLRGWMLSSLLDISKQAPVPTPPQPPTSGNTLTVGTWQESGGITCVGISSSSPMQLDPLDTSTKTASLLIHATNIDAEKDVTPESGSVTRVTVRREDPSSIRVTAFASIPVIASLSTADPNRAVVRLAPLNASLSGKTIVIDPGHSGPPADLGAVGPTGLIERDVNLSVSFALQQLLEDAGAKVVMTRYDNSAQVDLYSRPALANNVGADLFVSIHANSHPDPSIGGTEVYYRRDPVQPGSAELAQMIFEELVAKTGQRAIGVQQANFVVIRDALMPAILVETAFVSNPVEEAKLRDPDFIDKIAQGIFCGITRYLDGANP